MKILREDFEEAVIIRFVAALKRIDYTRRPLDFSTRANSRKAARRTFGGSSWNMKMLVTASWLSFSTGIRIPSPTIRLIRDEPGVGRRN